jgi:hypothetical protein
VWSNIAEVISQLVDLQSFWAEDTKCITRRHEHIEQLLLHFVGPWKGVCDKLVWDIVEIGANVFSRCAGVAELILYYDQLT